ncbi:hypothetical protein [Marinimicrobium alkaliphilum]|uniref:hypothetical protein n=1 Tax=Marinimicrobium alkaliphilum TaxID=2202654 RepID=UPI000DB97FCC|nr:hypothetical protein [Marinimicrobium alkaliphilum]
MSLIKATALGLTALALSACQHQSNASEPGELESAILNTTTAESRAELAETVGEALGADVRLSREVFTRGSLLIVERRHIERMHDGQPMGREQWEPDYFQLLTDGERCVLEHRDTNRRWTLSHADCRPH